MWLARDEEGSINLFMSKPELIQVLDDGEPCRYWQSDNKELPLSKEMYPEVTYTNSPVEVVLKSDLFL